MKRLIALAALAIAAASLPASAQMSDGKMMPSMDQCKAGYMKDYKDSMKLSKSKFKKTCYKMMKQDKMQKNKT